MFTNRKLQLINYLISLIPLSIILGNLAININVVLICMLGILIFKKDIFFIGNKKYQFLIYAFFFFLIFSTALNNLSDFSTNKLYKDHFFKSFFYLRFLILFLIINKLIEKNILNLRLFFISSAFFSGILAFDILVQVIFKKDLIGYPISLDKPSGFFGDENVAGGYLQKFSLFFIFLIATKFKNKIKNNLHFSIFYIFFTFFFIIILLTLNRMPLLIFLFSFLIYFFLERKFKTILFFTFFSIGIIYFFLKFPVISRMDTQIKNFYNDTINLILIAPKLFYNKSYEFRTIDPGPTGYIIHLNSGVQLWKKNKLIGNGIKSLPIHCEYKNNTTCNTHPHNYFIELMMDVGIVGLLIIYSIFFLGLFNSFKFYFSNQYKKVRYMCFPFFIIIFFEFFPLRSTGSFFTTSNAIIIFLFLAIFLNLDKITKLKKNYKI